MRQSGLLIGGQRGPKTWSRVWKTKEVHKAHRMASRQVTHLFGQQHPGPQRPKQFVTNETKQRTLSRVFGLCVWSAFTPFSLHLSEISVFAFFKIHTTGCNSAMFLFTLACCDSFLLPLTRYTFSNETLKNTQLISDDSIHSFPLREPALRCLIKSRESHTLTSTTMGSLENCLL